MGRLGLVVPAWRRVAAPAACLLAVTLAVVLVHSRHHTATPPAPAPKHFTAKKPVAPAPRRYTVIAGDTVGGIAAKTGVPATRIRALNPALQPTALFIGEKIRLR